MFLIVSDDGVGLPLELDFENTQSLGLQLVRLLAVHDLQGSVEIGNGPATGTQFMIKFPLPETNHIKYSNFGV
jgi:two-component sensor histidine kinase